MTAERGWGVCGLSCVFSRQRSCCPGMGEAEYGVRFFWPRRLGAEAAVMAEEGVMAEAAVHGSWGVKKPPILSGWALDGYADWGCSSLPKGIEVSSWGRLRAGVSWSMSRSSSASSAFRRPRFGLNLGSRARMAKSSSRGTPSRPSAGKGSWGGGIWVW